ncbi:BamA/TamA family outer membrane protein [Flavobacterium antarcticum]|uniref:translocation and assembly module lipoprotein TamL n=1 Tax=Flavobacterium antarcticum TaxID=271155 RepID=UPI0003B555B6|nr:BamA/TamA family outer membrane protein [Flavobacterium antarcticum]
MKTTTAKISLFILIGIFISACDAVKRVPDGKFLLTKNTITVDGEKEKKDEIHELLYQQPNGRLLGIPLALHIYNLAKPNHDSVYKANLLANPKKLERQVRFFSAKQVQRKGKSFLYSGIHNFLEKTGEAPVIVQNPRNIKSTLRLKSHFFNKGYFDTKTSFTIDTLKNKRAQVNYVVTKGKMSRIDSLYKAIASEEVDSLYEAHKNVSFLKVGDQFKSDNFELERERLTALFRNNGVFFIQQSDLNYTIDTVDTNQKTNVELVIKDEVLREGDSTFTRKFKIYKISEVNIYTDYPEKNTIKEPQDSVTYNNFNLYSYKKIKYKPKAITNAVFITPGYKYADFVNNLTRRSLSNLKVFNAPSIQYKIDERDSLQHSLIANIYLSPRDKYSFGYSLDFTHSNIQDFGIEASTSFTIRNIFNGAETFDIALRGNIGSSRDFANPDNSFFNVSEYGIDTRLNFPRILMPFNTDKIIPKRMIPSTNLSLGFAKQQNIGLDKENFTGALTYIWNPKRFNNVRFDLFNAQYVNNINVGNYFNVYSTSFNALNNLAQDLNYIPQDENLQIPDGANAFITDVLNNQTSLTPADPGYKDVRSINERRNRLSENNLIIASSYTFSKTTQNGLTDNNFYSFKTKLESAGNTLSLFASAFKTIDAQTSKKTIFDVQYSQYIKGEFEYIKHWNISRDQVLAVRGFFGLAVPYGNSTNIPFSRSYFAGGSNDIRAWQPYSLGPGSSGAINDFNEANMKLTASAELRFKLVNNFKGAVFIDAGNIWNVLDDTTDESAIFNDFKSFEEIAVGSGFGIRYDFSFFVVRLDLGFKTYNPSDEIGKRWFRDYNFSNSVLNIGINYPF